MLNFRCAPEKVCSLRFFLNICIRVLGLFFAGEMDFILRRIARKNSALRMEANTPQQLWVLCVGARSSSEQPDPTLGGKRPKELIEKKG